MKWMKVPYINHFRHRLSSIGSSHRRELSIFGHRIASFVNFSAGLAGGVFADIWYICKCYRIDLRAMCVK